MWGCGHCGHRRHLQHLGEQPPLLGASPIFTGTICACFVQDPLCPQCGVCPPTLLVLYQQHCVIRILILVTQTIDMGHSLIFLHRYCLSLVRPGYCPSDYTFLTPRVITLPPLAWETSLGPCGTCHCKL